MGYWASSWSLFDGQLGPIELENAFEAGETVVTKTTEVATSIILRSVTALTFGVIAGAATHA